MEDSTAYLLREIYDLRRENRELRRNLKSARSSRDRWMKYYRDVSWGFRQLERRLSTRSTDLSPSERAEASGVG